MPLADKSNQTADETERTHRARRLIVRSIVAGAFAALLMFAGIKSLRPALFEDRSDRVVEQCAKTGLAVFAFTLLITLARTREADS